MDGHSGLKAVILDWAGTMIDFGSLAPTAVFVDVMRRFGVAIAVEEARVPMGLPKRDHIAQLLALPRVAKAWRAVHGAEPGEADIDAVYAAFVPLNIESVTRFAALVPGAADTVAALRARGLKIGSTTGYTPQIMAPLLPLAASQGYRPDTIVCAGDVAAGRPTPLMIYKCFLDLAVWPAAACVKVDDTAPGIAEGVNAGTWTVAVTDSGNEVGLSLDEWRRLTDSEKADRRRSAADTLRAAGAHFVIDTVASLMPVIDEIEIRMSRREQP